MSRKLIKLNREQLDAITKACFLGSPEIVIAHELDLGNGVIGMNEATWHRLKKRDPRIAEALALGKAKQERMYHRNLMQMAPSNVVANIFPLKAKHGWRDQPDPPPDPQARIMIVQLPAPLAPGEYPRTIEAEPEPVALPEPSKVSG